MTKQYSNVPPALIIGLAVSIVPLLLIQLILMTEKQQSAQAETITQIVIPATADSKNSFIVLTKTPTPMPTIPIENTPIQLVENRVAEVTNTPEIPPESYQLPTVEPPVFSADDSWGPSSQILPDSELIYGPSAFNFSIDEAIPAYSYLRSYGEEVEGTWLNGLQIIELVSERIRVHPRLLIAALEYRSGWIRGTNPSEKQRPLQYQVIGTTGLYPQLKWVANQLNAGYYGFTELNEQGFWLADGTWIQYDPSINAGTAAVQRWLGADQSANYNGWYFDISSTGFRKTYEELFGNPFSNWLPPEPEYLQQPYLALPWSDDQSWYFTGGPHGGWGEGSAWAALDFVAPSSMGGCGVSADWITASADGVIAYSNMGEVILDLDGDGFSGTGWAVLYQHVATEDRIAKGTVVRTGDRIGHPSCEGGYSTGTHLHIARLYNGRWISADSPPYFSMSGWTAYGEGYEYNGTLARLGIIKVASIGRGDINQISAR